MENVQRRKFSDMAKFSEKQKTAETSVDQYKFVLYGGAMGGGKSYWLRWQLLKFLLRWHGKTGRKNITVGLFCEDYPSLKDRQLSKIRYEFPEWIGDFHVSDNNFVLKPEYGSGVIAFRNLDDPSKYQSSEFAAEAVDELTKNKREVFDFLRTRLRWPGISDVKFIAASNPGGIGHEWVKRMWIDRLFDENEQEADQFTYIFAKASDNPHLDSSYYKNLESLPEDMRKAFVDGDWNLFKGQYFKEWREHLHVCEPFPVQPYHRKFICGDYGYTAPSAVYWCFKDGDGVVYVYRELYASGLTYERLAAEIIARTPNNEEIGYWVFDPAIWAKKGELEICGADIMAATYKAVKGKGLNIIKGNNDRINGWNVMREHLRPIVVNGRQTARLQVFSTCYNLRRTLPSLVHDEYKPEDLNSDGEDHGADALRYGFMSCPTPSPRLRSPVEILLSRSGERATARKVAVFE